AVEFGKRYDTTGFDIQAARVDALRAGYDSTLEVDADELAASARLRFSADPADLRGCNVFIVTVPTPIDAAKRPDLTPLIKASETLGRVLKRGDIVVYESTVYPGCTEEVCVPILAKLSGLAFNQDFFAGYSPERINPGDKLHRVTSILKVTSGSTSATADFVDSLYGSIITAGTHKASCIKVAEAAKVIENTQRDLNIALMNELSLIFDRMGIDTSDVLEAAGTKWNFLKFRPGLVGGHCIGVDPYYLTHKAEKLGYIPQVILSGRRINDGMGKFVAQRAIKEMIRAGHNVLGSTVTVLGLTFKENCPDLRNSKVIDIIRELKDYGVNVQVADALADPDEAVHEYGVTLTPFSELKPASALVVAVSHSDYCKLSAENLKSLSVGKPVVIDVKGVYDKAAMLSSGINLWRL
ncbi:MAG: hypothetical protein B7Z74_07355, partial [Deltaproteobacteria bacterium 21-66-5]